MEPHPTSNHRLYLICGTSRPVARRNWVRIRQQLWLVEQTAAEPLGAPSIQEDVDYWC
ncbi:hypothetical protein IC230_00695 [Spirosoma sp. BT704]|uniref:Uncharacterized protein n=1 Tax=Spirosoma validum TaxID=2771355 RepID=A0A927GBH0_9BACT|nr:hypothetical protein [Spirosoma validum]